MQAYRNKSLSNEESAKDLLSLMTVDEKINQMHLYLDIPHVLEQFEKDEDYIPFGGLFNINAAKIDDIEKIKRYY